MKFYGKVGYVIQTEKAPGVWVEEPHEVTYFGDVLDNKSNWSQGQTVNGELTLGKQISIIADPFSFENFQWIKYVEFMGAKWSVVSADPQRPRIILSLGGLYNGQA